MNKHTPGPWTLQTVPTQIGSCHKIGPFTGARHDSETFACVYADGVRIGIDENNRRAVELAANAQLIAAAPDLLTACQKLDELDCCDGYGVSLDDHKILWEALSMARAAIGKAVRR